MGGTKKKSPLITFAITFFMIMASFSFISSPFHSAVINGQLPIPFGNSDLTDQLYAYNFYGVKVNNATWYTFACQGHRYDSYGDVDYISNNADHLSSPSPTSTSAEIHYEIIENSTSANAWNNGNVSLRLSVQLISYITPTILFYITAKYNESSVDTYANYNPNNGEAYMDYLTYELRYIYFTISKIGPSTVNTSVFLWNNFQEITGLVPAQEKPYYRDSGYGNPKDAFFELDSSDFATELGGKCVINASETRMGGWSIPENFVPSQSNPPFYELKITADALYYNAVPGNLGQYQLESHHLITSVYLYVFPQYILNGIHQDNYNTTALPIAPIPQFSTAKVNVPLNFITSDLAYGLVGQDQGKTEPIEAPVPLVYEFDWGDGSQSYYTDISGYILQASHTYHNPGTYNVKVRAIDQRAYNTHIEYYWSPWSAKTKINVVDWVSTPSAPYCGSNTSYVDSSGTATVTFTTGSIDGLGGQIRYTFYWGDGTSTTTGWYNSGATAEATHTFSRGSYSLYVVATAESGASSTSSMITINVTNLPG